VQRLNVGRGFWEPTALASVAYVVEGGEAELQYAHTATTNPLLGQTLLVDEVRLRGGVPLTKQVFIGGSTGYQRGRIVGDDARPVARLDTVLFDVGLGYQVVPSLLLGLRYQHVEQITDVSAPPLPLGFVRNTVLFGAVARFPPESEMPRAYRAPRRVDRKDEIRDAVATPVTSGGGSGQTGGSGR
jgi:hypothetical protein